MIIVPVDVLAGHVRDVHGRSFVSRDQIGTRNKMNDYLCGMRERLNLSLPEDLADNLARIAKRYGFKGSCDMTLALLRLIVLWHEGRLDCSGLSVGEIEDLDKLFTEIEKEIQAGASDMRSQGDQ